MMPLYPYPNASGIPYLFSYANNNTCLDIVGNPTGDFACGWFFPIILFTIFAIVFLSQKDTQPTGNAFALSSFITFIISTLLLPLGLQIIWEEIFFVALVISVISLWRSE